MSTLEFVRYSLMKSGISIDADFIPSSDIPNIIYSLNKGGFFSAAKYVDAVNIARAFKVMNSLVDDVETPLKAGQFKEKNEAILELYNAYQDYKHEHNLVDADDIIHMAPPMEAVILDEFPLAPIESRLVSNPKHWSLKNIFKFNDNIKSIKAYGEINEAKYILKDIYKNHSLDECVIACANPAIYTEVFNDLAVQYDIPITFGCGKPIATTNPAKLLSLIMNWETSNYFGIDGLYKILKSGTFNTELFNEKYLEAIGNLRICFNKATNDKRISDYEKVNTDTDFVRSFAADMEAGVTAFIRKYCIVDDEAALDLICNAIDSFLNYNPGSNYKDIALDIFDRNYGNSISEEGKVYLTTIAGAMSTVRPKLYACGLSSTNFPGSVRESYLLLDDDLKNFSDRAPLSDVVLDKKLKDYENLISLYKDKTLSYSSFDLAEVKPQNPSSVLFGNDFEEVNYFIDSNIIPEFEYKPVAIHVKDWQDREYSASAIDAFVKCPKLFYLQRLLDIWPHEPEDPLCIIDAKTFGNLAHKMMELLSGSNISKDEFKDHCSHAFDEYLLTRPAVFGAEVPREKKQFMDAMLKSYTTAEVISTETRYSAVHESGVKLKGYPDRVEKDGTLVDFKTGRNVKHKTDDIDRCVQVVMYAWLCEQAGIDIDHCEYWYLRLGQKVECAYDEAMKARFAEKLEELVKCANSNTWETKTKIPKSEKCTYCQFGDICQR